MDVTEDTLDSDWNEAHLSVKFCSWVVMDFLALLDKHNTHTLLVKLEKLTKV